MAVSFTVENGPQVVVQNNTQLLMTPNGHVQADTLQQGDYVCINTTRGFFEITSVVTVT